MKYILITISAILILVMNIPHLVNAQMMGRYQNDIFNSVDAQTNKTKEEEKEGKNIYDRLQSNEITCQALTDDEFELLGEYFMGQMVGDSHYGMNVMMKNMMGEDGEEQMHISLGKRSSGCDTDASFPSGYGLPMMGRMMGGGGNPMMRYGCWNNWGNIMRWGGFSFGWIFMLAFWSLIILVIVVLARYFGGTRQTGADRTKTPLDILKERYAKGEINKKEFEEIKKNLN